MRTQSRQYKIFLMIALLVIISLACSQSDINLFATATPSIPTATSEPTVTPKPLTPSEILNQSVEKLSGQSTFHYRVSVTLSISDQPPIKLGAVGSLENPDRAYSLVTMPDTSVIETLAVGTEIYTRTLDGPEWLLVPKVQEESTIQGFGVIKDINDFLLTPINLNQVADEKANNVDCYSLEFDLDPNVIMKDWAITDQADMQSATGKSKVWIGKGDLLIRQWRMELKYTVMGIPEIFIIEYTLYGFNEPVKIPSLQSPQNNNP